MPDQAVFHFHPDQKYYKGKVRDVYTIGSKVVMIASDRISAFDHILPRLIPHKGEVLTSVASYFLEATRDIVPNWLDAVVHPAVSVGMACEPIRLEMVVRAYLAGHAWREYKSGARSLCGVALPEGLIESDRLPSPIITPATKAEEGHDEDISKEEILSSQIVSEEIWNQLAEYSLALFARGTEMAAERGLILVDTKYEFGMYEGRLFLIDEVHTPDSSRYYIADDYEQRQNNGEPQQQLSKEFVREWLMEHGFQGKEGEVMPAMPDDFVELVSNRYIDLYERLTGQAFAKKIDQKDNSELLTSVREWLAENL